MGYLKPFKRKDRIGFKDNNKVLIHAIYDNYRVCGEYLQCGRYDNDSHSFVYDLFSRYGDLIFGGFSDFEETDNLFLFLLNGENKKEIVYQDDCGQNRIYDWVFHDENASWLVLDKDLLSVKTGEDGERVQFTKGFKVEIEHAKEDGKRIDYFNIDIELLTDEKPSFSEGYMMTSDLERAQAIRLLDGKATDYYDIIQHCAGSLFFICNNGALGIASFDNNVMFLGEYFAYTYPVNGFMFAFRHTEGDNCKVELLRLNQDSIGTITTVIETRPYKEIVDYILRGYFKITHMKGSIGIKSIGVLRPSVFDEHFSVSIAPGKNGEYLARSKDIYWFSNAYELNPEYHQ